MAPTQWSWPRSLSRPQLLQSDQSNLELLAGGGLDRHAHLGRPTPPDAPHPAQVAHERRVAALEPLRPQQALDGSGEQVGVALEQVGDAAGPALVDHPIRRVDLPTGRRTDPLDPGAHRRRVMADRPGTVCDREALAVKA